MRLAVLGAFPFPLPQGSQIFASDQAEALVRAGVEVTFICYGNGEGEEPEGVDIVRIDASLSPRSQRSGPNAGKPVADVALALAFVRQHRERSFDAVLAHNGEAAVAALAVRRITRVPVVYVAHTLLGLELSSYGAVRWSRSLDRLGRGLDRWIARRTDAVIALSDATATHLRGFSRGPVEWLPPGLDPEPPAAQATVLRRCQAWGLEPGRYMIYTGNLDAYQDVQDLEGAALRMRNTPLVVVTHASGGLDAAPYLRVAYTRSSDVVRSLVFGAAAGVVPRRTVGGFPIKLLNYLEPGIPIVARDALAIGLVHDESAWLLDSSAGPNELGDALAHLIADPDRARRIGAAGRAHLERRHAWTPLIEQTLELIRSITRA